MPARPSISNIVAQIAIEGGVRSGGTPVPESTVRDGIIARGYEAEGLPRLIEEGVRLGAIERRSGNSLVLR